MALPRTMQSKHYCHRVAKTRPNRRIRSRGAQTHKCGKIRYTSWGAAETAALLQGAKHDNTLRPYHCRGCLGFHLTSH